MSVGTSESGDETRATELFTGRAVAMMDLDGGMRGAIVRVPCSTLHNQWTQQKSNGDKCTQCARPPLATQVHEVLLCFSVLYVRSVDMVTVACAFPRCDCFGLPRASNASFPRFSGQVSLLSGTTYLAAGTLRLRFFRYIFCNLKLNIETFTDTSELKRRPQLRIAIRARPTRRRRWGAPSLNSVWFIVRVVTQHPVLSGSYPSHAARRRTETDSAATLTFTPAELRR